MMAMTQTRRRALLGAALALTLGAVAWSGGQDDGGGVDLAAPGRAVENNHTRSREGPRADNADAEAALALPRRPSMKPEGGNLFPVRSWYVPPPPPKLGPPPPPMAPPLPFTYVGKMVDGDQLLVFLDRQGRNYVVKAGDVIDGTYRVNGVQGAVLTLTYLPLNIQQSLQIGETH